MAAHRFRREIESISRIPSASGFMPCPSALFQLLSPEQQAVAQQLYQLAQSKPRPRVEVEPRWLVGFSAN